MQDQEALNKIFKAYDVRGIYPGEINEERMAKIVQAIVLYLKPQTLMIGRDARAMNPGLFDAAVKVVTEAGVDIIDLGLITTDMLYFAAGHLNLPGFSITASHNPAEYSGVKMILAGAEAISSDTGLFTIRDMAIRGESAQVRETVGTVTERDILPEYIEHILSFIDPAKIKPTKLVVNTMYGVASNVMTALAERLPITLTTLNFEIDGTFPKGPPNPLLPELRAETTELIQKTPVDFGVAWDGDADRVFFYDAQGNFIEGYYAGILMAKSLVEKSSDREKRVIHCARLGWLFDEVATEAGGISLENKVGHTFIKERMRLENALFAEEMSGHYYFRDNFYADNGMIPFLLILEMVSTTGKSLGELIQEFQDRMVVSGELNYEVETPKAVMQTLENTYGHKGLVRKIDGLTVEFSDWRFNVRPSNTEPLLRLNVEGRSVAVVKEKTAELEAAILSHAKNS